MMKALIWKEKEIIQLQEKFLENLDSGEILVRVDACAICGSDIKIKNFGNSRVTSGRTVGHEIAGTVVNVHKSVTKFKINDTISIGADIPCGQCQYCIKGISNNCNTNYAIGHQFEGGFAEYIKLNNLTVSHGPVAVYSNLKPEIAALAEPLACCINGMERIGFRENSNLLILGSGPIGIMLALLGKKLGAQKIAIADINQNRLEKAKAVVDYHFFDSSCENFEQEARNFFNNQIDFIFTACTSGQAHEQAIRLVSKRGAINLFGGLPSDKSTIIFDSNSIHYKEALVTGSHGSTPKHHEAALRMIERGEINLTNIVTHKYSLTDFQKAYQVAESGEALKVVIFPHA
jgi:L-iditol 2-dehydrogenase